jgi:hypothetical protein
VGLLFFVDGGITEVVAVATEKHFTILVKGDPLFTTVINAVTAD